MRTTAVPVVTHLQRFTPRICWNPQCPAGWFTYRGAAGSLQHVNIWIIACPGSRTDYRLPGGAGDAAPHYTTSRGCTLFVDGIPNRMPGVMQPGPWFCRFPDRTLQLQLTSCWPRRKKGERHRRTVGRPRWPRVDTFMPDATRLHRIYFGFIPHHTDYPLQPHTPTCPLPHLLRFPTPPPPLALYSPHTVGAFPFPTPPNYPPPQPDC